MKTRYKLKMMLSQLERQKDDIKYREKNFYSSQKLWEISKKVNNLAMQKQLFARMDDSRLKWWKSIDKKVELEQSVKVLKVKILEETIGTL